MVRLRIIRGQNAFRGQFLRGHELHHAVVGIEIAAQIRMHDRRLTEQADRNASDLPSALATFGVELPMHDFQHNTRGRRAGKKGQFHRRVIGRRVGVNLEGRVPGQDQDDILKLEQGRDQAGQLEGALGPIANLRDVINGLVNASHPPKVTRKAY